MQRQLAKEIAHIVIVVADHPPAVVRAAALAVGRETLRAGRISVVDLWTDPLGWGASDEAEVKEEEALPIWLAEKYSRVVLRPQSAGAPCDAMSAVDAALASHGDGARLVWIDSMTTVQRHMARGETAAAGQRDALLDWIDAHQDGPQAPTIFLRLRSDAASDETLRQIGFYATRVIDVTLPALTVGGGESEARFAYAFTHHRASGKSELEEGVFFLDERTDELVVRPKVKGDEVTVESLLAPYTAQAGDDPAAAAAAAATTFSVQPTEKERKDKEALVLPFHHNSTAPPVIYLEEQDSDFDDEDPDEDLDI